MDKFNEPKLSKRAEKLFERIKAGGWYPAFANNTPAAMQELVDAGLIHHGGRVARAVLCFVPSAGFEPMRYEERAA